MELLADIAVNASFVPAELEAEKKVVFEEMNILQDDPDKFLTRRLSELAYVGHPYGRPILGTPELVRDLTRDQLNAYYKKHYVPPNMVLVVVGPVPVAQVPRAGRRHLRPAVRRAGAPAALHADPVARRRASRRRPAPGAAGRPRPGVAGAGHPRGGRGHHRGRSADLHPGRRPELAAEPDGARGPAAGAVDRGELRHPRAVGHRRRSPRAWTPRTWTPRRPRSWTSSGGCATRA